MSVQAGYGIAGSILECSFGIMSEFVLGDIHSMQAVSFHGLVNIGRHCAQVLADHQAFLPVRLEAVYGIEFFGSVPDIDALAR